MSKRKEHKIRKMRKKRVWPTVLLTIFSFLFSFLAVAGVIVLLFLFTFDEKMQSLQENADNLNYAIEEHIENELQIASVYAKQLEDEVALFNQEELRSELEHMAEAGGYEDVGIWNMNADAPFTVNGLEGSTDSNFYQAFLEGKAGVYAQETQKGKVLIYTAVYIDENKQESILFLVEDSNLKIEGRKGTSFGENVGTYVLDSNNQMVGWVGAEDTRISYEDLSLERIDGLNGTDFTKDQKVYFESGQGLTTTLTDGKRTLDIDPQITMPFGNTDNKINSSKYVNGSLWIENDMISGWKTVSNQHLILEQAEFNKLIEIGGITLCFAFIPILLMLLMIVSQLHSRKQLTELLYLDNVTGGRNWLYFKTIATRILKKRKYRNELYAMVAFEVNHFRIFCDYNGGDAGDDLLENLNSQLHKMVGKGEVYGRYAGGHFGMLLQCQSEEQLKERVQNIFDMLSRNCTRDKISFSAGVYMIADKKILVDSIYNYASGAKLTGEGQLKTQIAMFDSKIRDQQLWEKEVEDTMEKALENREFAVYLQPKYDAFTEILSGAEALVRWISKDKGFISPGAFIPIFEKNGFITKLDDYMLDSVAKLQAQWIKEGKKLVPVSVNISRVHFTNPDLADHIRDIVDTYGTPHKLIELELTESAFFDDKNVLLNTVRKLKEYEFIVSMDDFGAGYSSLNSLKDLPLDVVKLDGEFFRDTEDRERGESVVRDTIHLAKNLNMKIVAEGIETKEQVEFLAESGCDFIQGFYFARPMPVNEFEKSAFKEDK